MARIPAEVTQGDALPSGFSSHTENSCPLGFYLMPHFLPVMLLLVILLFQMGPEHSVEVYLVFLSIGSL